MNLSWKAVYYDDSELLQYSDGVENRYKDIDRDKLKRFDIINEDKKKTILSVYFPKDENRQLIYRRRTFVEMGPEGQKRVIVYLVGWRQTYMTLVGPRNQIVINYIHEDGSISLDGARDNLEILKLEK